MKKTLLGLVLLLFYTFLIGETIPQESLEKGWELFRADKFEQANGYFEALIEDKTLLAEAYLGSAWCMMMLYEPEDDIELDTLKINLKNYEPNWFYIYKPETIYELYSENDDCLDNWVNNAIKLDSTSNIIRKYNPLHVKNDRLFGEDIQFLVDFGRDVENNNTQYIGQDIFKPEDIYKFYRASSISDFGEHIDYFQVSFMKIEEGYTIGLFNYYWEWLLDKNFGLSKSQTHNHVDTLKSIIIKHSASYNKDNEDHKYIVKNIYRDTKSNTRKILSVTSYRLEDGIKYFTLKDNPQISYNKYLQLSIMSIYNKLIQKKRVILPLIRPLENLYQSEGVDYFIEIERTRLFKNSKWPIDTYLKKAKYFAKDNDLKETIEGTKLFLSYYFKFDFDLEKINKNWAFKYNERYNYETLVVIKARNCLTRFENEKSKYLLKQPAYLLKSLDPTFSIEFDNNDFYESLNKIEKQLELMEDKYIKQIKTRRIYEYQY